MYISGFVPAYVYASNMQKMVEQDRPTHHTTKLFTAAVYELSDTPDIFTWLVAGPMLSWYIFGSGTICCDCLVMKPYNPGVSYKKIHNMVFLFALVQQFALKGRSSWAVGMIS